MGGERLRFWTVSYYGMDNQQLLEEIFRLERIEGSLDQRLISEIRIEQCKRLLEERKCISQ
jgi:hypothetical protein